ncbi:MAG: hypothetical protein H6706_02890 [Myxococcales bacterium]|nr:hypothetical protein [Myxococcales bacterium]
MAVSRQTPARPREQPSAHDLGFDEVPDLRAGDVLVHPRFGRCQVSKVSGDKVKVRRQTGALIDLALGVCRFLRDEDDERGRRVYRILLDR